MKSGSDREESMRMLAKIEALLFVEGRGMELESASWLSFYHFHQQEFNLEKLAKSESGF